MNNLQMEKNKVLVVYNDDGQNPANFMTKFHKPIEFPVKSQIRLINARLN